MDTQSRKKLSAMVSTLFTMMLIGIAWVAWAQPEPAPKSQIAEAIAPQPQLVTPLTTITQSANPRRLTVVGDTLFLVTDQPNPSLDTVVTLWQTDGTISGTWLVKQITQTWPSLAAMAGTSERLFLTIGDQLWTTTATPTATLQLIDLPPSGSEPNRPYRLTGGDTLIYFLVKDDYSNNTQSLWRSDGTISGTYSVTNNLDITSYSPMVATSDHLFFTADYYGLWFSDGSVTGTKKIKDIAPYTYNPDSPAYPGSGFEFTPKDAYLYFTASHEAEPLAGLWRSDGTASGTEMITSFPHAPRNLIPFQGQLYFTVFNEAAGDVLWHTDGTISGTQIAVSETDNRQPVRSDFIVAGDLLFYNDCYQPSETQPPQCELGRTDGQPEGTFLLTDSGDNRSAANLTTWDDMIYFTWFDEDGEELWRSDGTINGTIQVADINPHHSSAPDYLTLFKNQLFFAADGDAVTAVIPRETPATLFRNIELWHSDGTASGTQLFKDFNTLPADAQPELLVYSNGQLFFAFYDSYGRKQLRVTRGTGATTHPLGVEIGYPGTAVSAKSGWIYFKGYDETEGTELWRSDGTLSGTIQVADINPDGGGLFGRPYSNFVTFDDTLFFGADDGQTGKELWRSDGTAEGTYQIRDINPSGSSDPNFLTEVDGMVNFLAYTSDHGDEPWQSDGSTICTSLVKDILPGESGSLFLPGFTAFNNQLYFFINETLYHSDGTIEGTYPILDAYPGDYGRAVPLGVVNEQLFFNASTRQSTLWRSDGTTQGTIPLHKNIWSTNQIANIGNLVYFLAGGNSDDKELWRSDGTIEGTTRIATVNERSTLLTTALGRLYFSAPLPDEENGVLVLWQSDGTISNTFPVQPITSSTPIRYPQHLFAAGNQLYFTGYTPETGQALWIINEPTPDNQHQNQYHLYFPDVRIENITGPDLVVRMVCANEDSAKVIIQNRGNQDSINPFWVDMYIDPVVRPQGVNDVWHTLSSQGLVWGVTQNLAPGEMLALTYTPDGTNHYFSTEHSLFNGNLAPFTRLYAQVDSANTHNALGAVWELDEMSGGSYNNVRGAQLSQSGTGLENTAVIQSAPRSLALPPRE